MTLPETLVLSLTSLGFVGALVFTLVFWKRIKLPKNTRKVETGITPGGCVVYLVHGRETLQDIPLKVAIQAVSKVLDGWDSMSGDPRVRKDASLDARVFDGWSSRDLDDIVIYVASYSDYDAKNGTQTPDHEAACLVRCGRWFGKSVPCVMIRDGLFSPKTGEPIQHEVLHACLREATNLYDFHHRNKWVWTAGGQPGNLQGRSSLGG